MSLVRTARVCSLSLLATLLAACAGQAQEPPRQLALLVGCTKYPDSGLPALEGPRNDVPLYVQMLTSLFGFPRENLTTLVGWPDDESQRPTFKNIVAGFERLIARAGPGTQVFILLAGHGAQIPLPETQQDALDPNNPEPDGLDEVFLPADVKRWTNGVGLQNHILDDQIGRWLAALKDRGAHVWIVFDCCHSGNMSRDPLERLREVTPDKLGVPREALEAAARKAAIAQKKLQEAGGNRARGLPVGGDLLQMDRNSRGTGSIVAFFAAQPFETTPELPRPVGAPPKPDNYYGLLSYTLMSILKQHGQALTYRELAQLLSSAYRAERGANGPNPFCEGDLDRQVLGSTIWPQRSALILQRKRGQLEINAGELLGITPGSILSVLPPITAKTDPKKILGYVRVKSATPGSAVVEPTARPDGKQQAVKAADLPDLARCELVQQDMGEMRIRLAFVPLAKPGPAQVRWQEMAQESLKRLPREISSLVQWTDNPSQADWQITVDNNGITLRRNEKLEAKPGEKPRQLVPEGYVQYQPDDTAQLTGYLARDVQRIYTWQNIWRIAAKMGKQSGRSQLDMKIVKLDDKNQPAGLLTSGSVVVPAQKIQIEISNRSLQDLYVTVLFLDSRCGLDVSTSSLQAGKEMKIRGTIESTPGPGVEGVVVLAMPIEPGQQPNYDCLKQVPLGHGGREADRAEQVNKMPATPFNRLLQTAALGQGARGFRIAEPTNPTRVLSWSWVTLPGKE